jgi:cardiolipin synthase A/B
MSSLVGSGWCGGNAIRTLSNGDEIFPAMLTAIRAARRSIDFETFVYEHGDIPAAFATALEERARAGVKVNVILDSIGAAKSLPYRNALREAGVELIIYHSPWWLDPRRNNHRTHRKILVVDGRVGFIGGVGISDLWKGNASSSKETRDLHYRIEGPVVAQLQGAFEDNWMNSREAILLGPEYFPVLSPAGGIMAGAFFSSPLRGRSALELMYHLVIASSRQTLCIENAYFLPDSTLVEALCAAARRGVHVRILLPGKYMDEKAVQRHSRKTWPRLLAAGVKISEYDPTMDHVKLVIADGLFVSIGSGNLDFRSLRINDEANLNILDATFAREQTRIFEGDLRRAHRVVLHGTSLVELPQQTAETPLEPQL